MANTDPEFLRQRLGKNGVALWNYANGNDLSLVAKKDFVSPIKSVGHGITTVADLEKPEQVWPVFLELTQDIGHKLRVHGLSAEGVAIHIRDNTLDTRQWQTKIALPTQSPMVIAKTAFQLFEKRYGWLHPSFFYLFACYSIAFIMPYEYSRIFFTHTIPSPVFNTV